MLSKVMKVKKNSRLIYPVDVLDMTKMIINHNKCSEKFGRDLLLVILVFNRIDGFERRQTIRETWGQDFNSNPKSRVYFTVGRTKDQTIQKKLIEENNKFNDILQFGYYESYYNCTIKALGLLRWTAMSCPFVKYMIKVDDDSVLLANNLLNFCDKTKADSMFGYLWSKPYVSRGKDKWSISVQDFSDKFYPDYIGGPYLLPGSKALALYKTAITEALPALPFEDVYLTGIVANKLSLRRRRLSSELYIYGSCDPFKLDYCHYRHHTIFWQGLNDKSIRHIWNIYNNTNVCLSSGGKRC